MSITKLVKFIVKCSKKDCSKKLEVEGGNTNGVYAAVRKNGWQWKGMKEQYCPDHASKHEAKLKAKPAKKAKKQDKPARKVAKLLDVDGPSA